MARNKSKKTKASPAQQSNQSTDPVTTRVISTIQSLAQRNDIKWIMILLTLLTVFAYYPDQADDYDTWWHVKYGEQYVTNMTWHIDHSDFSWTPSIADWKKVTWLGSSFLYIAYKAGSYQGLYLLRLVVFAGVVLLLLSFIKKAGDSFGITHLAGLFLIAVAINPTAIYLKPEMFTLLFFAAVVYVYFASKQSSKNLFYVYPPLFVLWVNIHAGYVIGLVFITGVLIGETVTYLFLKKNSMPKDLLIKLVIFTGFSYAALMVNPYGVSFITGHFARLASSEQGVNRLLVDSYINRWQYLFPKTYVFRRTNTAWALVVMQASFLALCAYCYLKKRYLDLTVMGLNIIFFYFSMKMARGALYFPFIWFFSVIYVVKHAGLKRLKNASAPYALCAVLLCAVICNYNTVTANTYRSWCGSNLNECVPKEETEYIMSNNLPAPVFNDYLTGGYMIWSMYPRYKVFIDPRYQPYVNGVWEDFLQFRRKPDPDGLNTLLAKYPFKTAILHHISYGPLTDAFLNSADWRCVFVGNIAAVFVHTSQIDSLSPGTVMEYANPEKFRGINNPRILYSLFGVYLGLDRQQCSEILKIYKDNVSTLYNSRKKHIAVMERVLASQ